MSNGGLRQCVTQLACVLAQSVFFRACIARACLPHAHVKQGFQMAAFSAVQAHVVAALHLEPASVQTCETGSHAGVPEKVVHSPSLIAIVIAAFVVTALLSEC